ncbi:DUF2997 domain-containing protein [Mumia sp. zg.B21]|uniref:DUF2997 domain-containing protein n=1 Tax=unclassified Mumia TaxID=2621872 RepID=UPI001C6E6B6E|nr:MULTISPECIES: DUF2997 domain-containing protein [unclassified Mumia]MBW9208662.1 DUF2997 domain-containing protein [Mumia sp. zg.B21]MDD9350527.1 DUF2997 domain-containing protein [Mumia sp.]
MAPRKQLRVRVARDGTVSAETIGFTGPECLDQVAVLEDLLDALSSSSSFTEEYWQTDHVQEEGQSLDTGRG